MGEYRKRFGKGENSELFESAVPDRSPVMGEVAAFLAIQEGREISEDLIADLVLGKDSRTGSKLLKAINDWNAVATTGDSKLIESKQAGGLINLLNRLVEDKGSTKKEFEAALSLREAAKRVKR